MKIFFFDDEFICRYKKFLSSDEYNNVSDYSKSKYWQYFSKRVEVKFKGNKIIVDGVSGFYIPAKDGVFNNLVNMAKKAMNNPVRALGFLADKVKFKEKNKSFISYGESFNAVMNSCSSSEQNEDERRLDFKKIANDEWSCSTLTEIKKRSQNNYALNSQMIYSHYVTNILYSCAELSAAKTVIEIGAGNGNLLSVLRYADKKKKLIDIDLPETLSHAILYIADLFPEATIIMPHEANAENIKDCDFVFLTPSQLDLIDDDSVDISINTFSFQEMTHKQINEYFDLIQRSGKNDTYFFTSNRERKTPSAKSKKGNIDKELPNLFNEYPWNNSNEILAHELCRLMEKVQKESVYIHLERIRKP